MAKKFSDLARASMSEQSIARARKRASEIIARFPDGDVKIVNFANL